MSDIRSVHGGCSRFSRCCYLIIVLSSSIKCRSEKEFDELVGKYFDIIKPAATSVVLPFDTPAAANRHLPPNTKMAGDLSAPGPDKVFEDVRYCIQYPNDSLEEPNGQLDRCRDMMALIEQGLTSCRTGPDSKTEACRNRLAFFAAAREGRR